MIQTTAKIRQTSKVPPPPQKDNRNVNDDIDIKQNYLSLHTRLYVFM